MTPVRSLCFLLRFSSTLKNQARCRVLNLASFSISHSSKRIIMRTISIPLLYSSLTFEQLIALSMPIVPV